jgi:sarcosine oxidase
VVGLGVLGAFALRALARRGHRVVGFDAEIPPHALGASHGRTRIIRTAYFEHPLYVPLARESWEGWRALERERGVRLLEETGALMLGSRGGRVVRGTLESARTHGLPHEVLEGGALQARYPALASGLVPGPDPDRGADSGSHPGLAAGGDAGLTGVFEPGAGILQVEGAVEAALASAVAHGARVVTGARVEPEALAASGRRVVVAPGGWLGPWVAPWLRVEVERQVVFWFRREDGGEGKDGGKGGLPPVGLHEYAPGRAFYWITEPGLVKAAFHHQGDRVTDPAGVERRPPSAVAWRPSSRAWQAPWYACRCASTPIHRTNTSSWGRTRSIRSGSSWAGARGTPSSLPRRWGSGWPTGSRGGRWQRWKTPFSRPASS